MRVVAMISGSEKTTDGFGDLVRMRFQREVARVEEANLCVRNIALESLGARRQEERIVLSPHREKTRVIFAEVSLECRIQRDVALVVQEQIQLNLVGALAC